MKIYKYAFTALYGYWAHNNANAVNGLIEKDSNQRRHVTTISGPTIATVDSPTLLTMKNIIGDDGRMGRPRVSHLQESRNQMVSQGASTLRGRMLQYVGAWKQLGPDIDGEAAGDMSGWSVALSSNGDTVAIGSFGNDGGCVRVYRYNSRDGRFIQIGSDIDIDGKAGWSVALSSDGDTVAISAPFTHSGRVQVFRYNSSEEQFTQIGANIDGEAAGDHSGISVALSSEGDTVAIGAYGGINGFNVGHARVYRYNSKNGQFTQIGDDIDGEEIGDQSGWSVALSSDGDTVAIGAYGSDGVNGTDYGRVRVHRYNSIEEQFTQLGDDINGEAAGDRSGHSVELSWDGNTVAIGAYDNDGVNGTDSGHVRVYRYNSSNGQFAQLGDDIDGEAANDRSGGNIALSLDGETVAIGAHTNRGVNGQSSGHARVYRYNSINGQFIQLGDDIDGEAALDSSGWSVALSSGGDTVAIGTPFQDEASGQVRIYKWQPLVNPAPWVIIFQNFTADFSFNSVEEIVLVYEVGQGRDVSSFLYGANCESRTSIIGIEPTVKNTTTAGEAGMDVLTLSYSFDKAKIANSSVWNSTTSKIELCQIVQLTLFDPNDDEPPMIIAHDMREISIDFNLTSNYEILGTNLDKAAINANNTTTDVSSYVEACKCNATSFNCDDDAFAPNDQLFLCIYSKSTDVGIADLKSMAIAQQGDTSGTKRIDLIDDSLIQNPSLTLREYVSSEYTGEDIDGEGVRVMTWVPINLFDFEEGTKIDITGFVEMELVGSATNGRKLSADVVTGMNGNEEASYELEVVLQQQFTSPEEDSISYATSAASNGVAGLVLVFALFSVMW